MMDGLTRGSSTPSGTSRSNGTFPPGSCLNCYELRTQISNLQSEHSSITYYWQESESKYINFTTNESYCVLLHSEKASVLENEVIRMKVDLDKKLQEFIEVTGAYAELKVSSIDSVLRIQ